MRKTQLFYGASLKSERERKILRVENKNEEGKRRDENQLTTDKSASISLSGMKIHTRVFYFCLFCCCCYFFISVFSAFRVFLVLMSIVAGWVGITIILT